MGMYLRAVISPYSNFYIDNLIELGQLMSQYEQTREEIKKIYAEIIGSDESLGNFIFLCTEKLIFFRQRFAVKNYAADRIL